MYLFSYRFTKFVIEKMGYDFYLLFLKDKNYFLSKGKDLYDEWIDVF